MFSQKNINNSPSLFTFKCVTLTIKSTNFILSHKFIYPLFAKENKERSKQMDLNNTWTCR